MGHLKPGCIFCHILKQYFICLAYFCIQQDLSTFDIVSDQLKEGRKHPTVAGDSFPNEEPGSHTNVSIILF